MKINSPRSILRGLALIWALSCPSVLLGTHPCSSPLILDLDGDGVLTTTLNYPVTFDVNADGFEDRLAWTFPGSDEGFLWVDLNHNRQVDSGAELFGDAMMLPHGELAQNGFEALKYFDDEASGGDGDGLITHRDLIWSSLRLWIDRNHDGTSQSTEIYRLPQFHVLAIGLDYEVTDEVDSGGNLHRFQGAFTHRVKVAGRPTTRTDLAVDVIFATSE